jgi:hypothetical protein
LIARVKLSKDEIVQNIFCHGVCGDDDLQRRGVYIAVERGHTSRPRPRPRHVLSLSVPSIRVNASGTTIEAADSLGGMWKENYDFNEIKISPTL